jgi:hypothetical protein
MALPKLRSTNPSYLNIRYTTLVSDVWCMTLVAESNVQHHRRLMERAVESCIEESDATRVDRTDSKRGNKVKKIYQPGYRLPVVTKRVKDW